MKKTGTTVKKTGTTVLPDELVQKLSMKKTHTYEIDDQGRVTLEVMEFERVLEELARFQVQTTNSRHLRKCALDFNLRVLEALDRADAETDPGDTLEEQLQTREQVRGEALRDAGDALAAMREVLVVDIDQPRHDFDAALRNASNDIPF